MTGAGIALERYLAIVSGTSRTTFLVQTFIRVLRGLHVVRKEVQLDHQIDDLIDPRKERTVSGSARGVCIGASSHNHQSPPIAVETKWKVLTVVDIRRRSPMVPFQPCIYGFER